MRVFYLLILIILFSSCTNQKTIIDTGKPANGLTADAGRLVDDTFTYDNFGFEITKASSWYAVPDDARIEMMKLGMKTIKDDAKTFVELSSLQTITLFTFYKYAPGTLVDENPNISAIAENLKLFPGIKDGKVFLEQLKKTLKNVTQIKYTINDSITSRTLDGKNFAQLNTKFEAPGGVKFNQIYLARKIKGYAFAFVITYLSGNSLEEINKIFESIKLKY